MLKFSYALKTVGFLSIGTGVVAGGITHEERKRQTWFKNLPPEKQEQIKRECALTYYKSDLSAIASVQERMLQIDQNHIKCLSEKAKRKKI